MLKTLIDGLGAAVGGIAAASLPSFVQQYLAGLSACESELGRIVTEGAARAGVMSPEYLAETQVRATWCADAAQAIDQAIGLKRMIVFAQNFDPDIARATLRVFQPGLQMSLDGLYFFLGGVLLGLIVVNILMWPFRLLTRRRNRAWR
jgi:hypothetical protein